MLPLLTTLPAPQAGATAQPSSVVPEAESAWLPELSFDMFWNESADEEETASDADTPVEEGVTSAEENLIDAETETSTEPHTYLPTDPVEPSIQGRVAPGDATIEVKENSPISSDRNDPSFPTIEAKVSRDAVGRQDIDDTVEKLADNLPKASASETLLAVDKPVSHRRDVDPLISLPRASKVIGDPDPSTTVSAPERLTPGGKIAPQISAQSWEPLSPETPKPAPDQRTLRGPSDTVPPDHMPARSLTRVPAADPSVIATRVAATGRPINTAPAKSPVTNFNPASRVESHRAPLPTGPVPDEVNTNTQTARTLAQPINPPQVSSQPTAATAPLLPEGRSAGLSPAEMPKTEPDRHSKSPDRIAPLATPPSPPVVTSVAPPASSGAAPVFASLSHNSVSDRPGPDPLHTSELRFTSDAPSQPRSTPDAPQMRSEFPRHMAAQLAEAIQRGGSNRPVDLTLSPAELGRVKISLSTADGSVTVHVSAERPETLDLMRRHADLLAQEFHMIGYGAAQFSFSQQRSDPHQNNPQDALIPTDDETTAIATTAPATTQALSITDRIDIRV